MKRLRDRAQALLAAEVPTVLTGDYNVIPHDDDVWDPRAMANDALMQPDSRDAWFRMLGDGWTDALRSRHPTGHAWTFWAYQAGGWQPIGRAHVCTPVTNAPLVCRLLLG